MSNEPSSGSVVASTCAAPFAVPIAETCACCAGADACLEGSAEGWRAIVRLPARVAAAAAASKGAAAAFEAEVSMDAAAAKGEASPADGVVTSRGDASPSATTKRDSAAGSVAVAKGDMPAAANGEASAGVAAAGPAASESGWAKSGGACSAAAKGIASAGAASWDSAAKGDAGPVLAAKAAACWASEVQPLATPEPPPLLESSRARLPEAVSKARLPGKRPTSTEGADGGQGPHNVSSRRSQRRSAVLPAQPTRRKPRQKPRMQPGVPQLIGGRSFQACALPAARMPRRRAATSAMPGRRVGSRSQHASISLT